MINTPDDNVVDSEMTREEILAQNPKNPAPQEVVNSMDVVSVTYYGFDGALHVGQIAMNEKVVEDVKKFFDLAVQLKFPIEKVIPISNERYVWDDEISCNDNNTSGYNYRLIAGTNKMSKHAEGLAFDVNPVQNPYIKFDNNSKEVFRFPKDATYDEKTPGTLNVSHPLVVLMKELDWDWGGDWTSESGRTDYQHFEKNI